MMFDYVEKTFNLVIICRRIMITSPCWWLRN